MLLFSAAAHADSVDDLDWLAGCWSYDGRESGSGDQLLGRIEGTVNGDNAAFDFPMSRVDCAVFG